MDGFKSWTGITFYKVAGLFGKVYNSTATLQKAINGFESTGLWPFNPDVFTDDDFAPSLVTTDEDPASVNLISVTRPIPVRQRIDKADYLASTDNPPVAGQLLTDNPPVAGKSTTDNQPVAGLSNNPSVAEPSTTANPSVAGPSTIENPSVAVAGITNAIDPSEVRTPIEHRPVTPKDGGKSSRQLFDVHAVIEQLSPTTKLPTTRKRARKSEEPEVITSSPYKKQFLEKEAKKTSKTLTKIKKEKLDTTKGKGKGKGKGKAQTKAKDESESDSDDEYDCLVCGEDYSNSLAGEKWITCAVCSNWAHIECTPGVGLYICHNCDSDDSFERLSFLFLSVLDSVNLYFYKGFFMIKKNKQIDI